MYSLLFFKSKIHLAVPLTSTPSSIKNNLILMIGSSKETNEQSECFFMQSVSRRDTLHIKEIKCV